MSDLDLSNYRAANLVLKKAVLEEQTKNSLLESQLKAKEQQNREAAAQIDLLSYHNDQLTKRIESLREELKHASRSSNRKKGKNDDNSHHIEVYAAELRDKIDENEQLHRKIADAKNVEEQLELRINELDMKAQSFIDVISQLESENSSLQTDNQILRSRQEIANKKLEIASRRDAVFEQQVEDFVWTWWDANRISSYLCNCALGNSALPTVDTDAWANYFHTLFDTLAGYHTAVARAFPSNSNHSTRIAANFKQLSAQQFITALNHSITQYERVNLTHNQAISASAQPNPWDAIIDADLSQSVSILRKVADWFATRTDASDGAISLEDNAYLGTILVSDRLRLRAVFGDLERHWRYKMSAVWDKSGTRNPIQQALHELARDDLVELPQYEVIIAQGGSEENQRGALQLQEKARTLAIEQSTLQIDYHRALSLLKSASHTTERTLESAKKSFAKSADDLSHQLEQSNLEKQALADQKAAMDEEIRNVKRSYDEKIRESVAEAEREVERKVGELFKGRVKELEEEKEMLLGQVGTLNEAVEMLHRQVEEARSEGEERVGEVRRRIGEVEKEREEVVGRVRAFVAEIEGLKGKVEKGESERVGLKEQIGVLEAEVVRLQETVARGNESDGRETSAPDEPDIIDRTPRASVTAAMLSAERSGVQRRDGDSQTDVPESHDSEMQTEVDEKSQEQSNLQSVMENGTVQRQVEHVDGETQTDPLPDLHPPSDVSDLESPDKETPTEEEEEERPRLSLTRSGGGTTTPPHHQQHSTVTIETKQPAPQMLEESVANIRVRQLSEQVMLLDALVVAGRGKG
ncbi:hypothetical protein HDV00_007427 [Rhizophlyctis rosea]|nr:hypothetical protein HDV00_007427 [Rhizophlyctis rosea]